MQISSLKPLTGMRIVVTRPKELTHTLSERLRELGATIVELPTIEIIPVENTAPLDDTIRRLDEYDWLILTSVHGAQFFMGRLAALKVSLELLNGLKVATIGPATAAALERAGKTPDYIPDEYLSERIVHGLGNVRGKRILLPRADIASKKLPALLHERGALVDEIVAYRTVAPRDLTCERLKSVLDEGVDLVTFTSSSTVRNFARALGGHKLGRFLHDVKVACIGPVTVEAARELGIEVDIVAKTHTIEALVEAIVNETRSV